MRYVQFPNALRIFCSLYSYHTLISARHAASCTCQLKGQQPYSKTDDVPPAVLADTQQDLTFTANRHGH